MRLNKKSILLWTLFTLFLIVVPKTFAANPEIKEGYYTIKSALKDDMVLDISKGSKSNKAKVQLHTSNRGFAQVFYVSKTPDGAYQFEAACSDKMLGVQNNSKKPGAKVCQHENNGKDTQKWHLKPAGKGYVYINSKANGLNLDVCNSQTKNGTQIQTYTPNKTKAQKFKFEKFYPTENEAALQNDKRDYSTRLTWFEDKIANYYSNFNAKNILVTGNEKFCDNFKKIAEKGGGKKFYYASTVKEAEDLALSKKFDLIINIKFSPNYNNIIFNKSKNVSFFKDIYEEILIEGVLEHFKENGISIFFFEAPLNHKVLKLNLNDFERNLLSKYRSEKKIFKNKELFEQIYGDNIDCKNFFFSKDFWDVTGSINKGNYSSSIDYKSKYYNCTNGKRLTTDAPENYQNSIYMFGVCTVRGWYTSDQYTISSFLQRRVNQDFKNRYLSVNCGIEFTDELNDFEYMLHTTYKPGDIVIEERNFGPIIRKVLQKTNTPYFELSPIFNQPHNYGNWVVNSGEHINHNGNNAVADYMYKIIKNTLQTEPPPEVFKRTIKFGSKNISNTNENFFKENPDFQPFLDNLKAISEEHKTAGKKIGAIVVNCNPFTLGHRYLIEDALKSIDHLYIFAVEEDASHFTFKDRFEMIKLGVSDLKNVTVMKTGKWMVSRFTFPEYFDKENLQDKAVVDPTMDTELFGKHIAPALGITIRFVGEEPFDSVTRQYNNLMREELPTYGIAFREILRKTLYDGQVISATKVRKLLKDKNFEELKKFVPESTFNYLTKNLLSCKY